MSGAGRERRRLALSLVANAATRIPAAIGVLLFLPLARAGLGVADYAAMLAALALGGAATFVFGGIGIAARRMIGAAHDAGDDAAQGDAFGSLLAIDAILLAFASIGVIAWQAVHGAAPALLFVALIPVLAAAANLFDSVRAAYNEHYVTATVQFVVQTVLYALGIGVAIFARDIVLSAMVIGGGNLIASLIAGVLLVRAHPALRRVGSGRLRGAAVQSGGAGIADGLLMSGLALAVVVVELRGDAVTGAWFATMVRLFQTFLSPVLLILVPVASYLRIGWDQRPPASRCRVLRLAMAGGAVYGVLAGVGLALAAELYVVRILDLSAPGSVVALSVFALFGAIVLYKSYTSIAFVLIELRHLALGSAAVVAASFVLAMAMPDIGAALLAYASVTAAGLAVLVADSARRYRGA